MTPQPGKRDLFTTRFGAIATTVGSAVGLGNIWRFPYEAGTNGGGAFMVCYIICIFLLGVPVICAEFVLGRSSRSNYFGAMRHHSRSRFWPLAGYIGILASLMILSFYSVVAGWTVEYTVQSAIGSLDFSDTGGYHEHFDTFVTGNWRPAMWTLIFLALNFGILMRGVRKGIERFSNILMPLLFVLLIVFCINSLAMDGAREGLEFLFRPDFASLTPATMLSALGQAFFSLSLGMGILITYASYFPRSTKLTRTAVTVSMLDLLVAILMGFIIFPAVTSFGLTDESLRGSTLVFVTLPEVFALMPATQVWSVLFFLLLFVAALTSTISIAEVSVAFVCDRFSTSRITATLIVLLPIFGLSTLCALSQAPDSTLTIGSVPVFDFLDDTATNILLPVVAFFTCIYVGWFAPPKLLYKEVSNRGSMAVHTHGLILFILRFIAPLLTAVILLSRFI